MTVSSNVHVIYLVISCYIWWLMGYLTGHIILRGRAMNNGAKVESISHIWTYFQSLFVSS